MAIDYNAIPIVSKDIVARKDSNGMLLFQVRSDEIFFIPSSAYNSILLNCDGSQTLEELHKQLNTEEEPGKLTEDFENFISKLHERKVIELW
jgi:hypothetical protein